MIRRPERERELKRCPRRQMKQPWPANLPAGNFPVPMQMAVDRPANLPAGGDECHQHSLTSEDRPANLPAGGQGCRPSNLLEGSDECHQINLTSANRLANLPAGGQGCRHQKSMPNAEDVESLPPPAVEMVSAPNCRNPFLSSAPWPSNLMEIVSEIANGSCCRPEPPEFQFTLTRNAAETNLKVLEKYGMDLQQALEGQKKSPLGYGSEFRPVSTLVPLLGRHPNWNRLKAILDDGSDWPLEGLSLEERRQDVEDALAFGNHKGAESNQSLLRKLIEKMSFMVTVSPCPWERSAACREPSWRR